MGSILLTGEVAPTQTLRHEIRKRVRMYGRYMLVFFDVTVGFISSFFCFIFHICLGFRVYISCPYIVPWLNQYNNTPHFTCGHGRYEMVFIPSDWFSNCCFLNSRKIAVTWRSTS